ncbi:hypothetical protein [Sphingomonas hankookensis]
MAAPTFGNSILLVPLGICPASAGQHCHRIAAARRSSSVGAAAIGIDAPATMPCPHQLDHGQQPAIESVVEQ